ncbi:MAG: response regulator, partial [Chitinivibrionales bacterium]|nr:response regulator [Chitinivibrionales bacterium]MBD3395161.1 response regulator [Chitinivibrionales bacterium]
IRDITDRKRAEEEHRSLQEQLNQAHKMEAIGRLAGGVAHDFNNMLSGIMGYAEVIKRRNRDDQGQPGDPELDRHIDVIIKAPERAGDLTEKLLAFSRQGKYQVVPVNIHDTIAEVKGLLEHTMDRRIEIHEDLRAEPPVVMGDPTQLQNVVLNLAMNARDAMPDGGALAFTTDIRDVDVEFADSLVFRMMPGRYLVLSVSDTGVGMDEQTRRRVFEPFFTTKGIGEGVGLGLSSVYGTVKGHHGAILVDSAVGKGTTCNVYLPAHEEGKAPHETGVHEIPKGSGTILVVDDEEMVRTILTQLLRELGYAVATCGNGGEAIEYYRRHGTNVDLVILDMNMPVMSGAECLAELRKLNPGVKVIIATGYSFQSKTQKILATGVSGFVKKPFKLADLSDEIKRVLEEESAG